MSQEPVDARYLYEQIYRELKEEILSGTYRKGDWFPPERVLKDRFNTTHLTVRNALAKLVLEGYIERYSGKGTLVIYSREWAASPRKPLKFPYAHVILAGLDEANARILEGMEAQLRKVPLSLRFSLHHGDVLIEQSLYQEAEATGALVILEPAGSVDELAHIGLPIRNTIVIQGADARTPCARVAVDDALGARKAVRYLLDLGHRTIALCNTARTNAGAGIRQGFDEELSARGILDGAELVENCAPGTDAGTAAVRKILARRPDCRAFFCASDEIASGAIRGLHAAGLPAGTDSSVIGYGNSRLAESTGLTTVDPGLDRLAASVVSIALEGIDRGSFIDEVYRIPPELRIRESCTGAVNKG